MKQLLIVEKQVQKRAYDLELLVTHKKRVFVHAQSVYETYHGKLKALTCLQPGKLVRTKLYGEVVIVAYRVEDDMVVCALPFGSPPAKGYIYAREIMDCEDTINQTENLLMAAEDTLCRRIYQAERIAVQKERYLMAREEEHIRKVYEYMELC
ncbi:hypothetical protein EON65_56270, partial [archaeon]